MRSQINRREALAGLSTISLGALLAACSDDESTDTQAGTSSERTETGSESTGTTTDTTRFDDSASCTLTAEQTEGPYYFDVDAIRSDIRDDREGTALNLAIRVRDAESCEPLRDAVVDIWHCDAGGVYSGFESGEGETFLRGTQVTDRDGVAEFTTIYPGWYQGRTVHIHAKVHLDRETVLTTQLYFDEQTSRRVYSRSPYAGRGQPEMTNADDGIFDESLLLTLRPEGDAIAATMNFDVQRA